MWKRWKRFLPDNKIKHSVNSLNVEALGRASYEILLTSIQQLFSMWKRWGALLVRYLHQAYSEFFQCGSVGKMAQQDDKQTGTVPLSSQLISVFLS